MANHNLKLAITTIGDLLCNQRVSRDEDGKRMDDVQLTIPDYQRPYKWKPENANQLLDDILQAKRENKEVYRVGTLILHQERKENQLRYCIVDGQQRTITFALLLRALGKDVAFLDEKVWSNSICVKNILQNFSALDRRISKASLQEKQNLLSYVEHNCELIVVITTDISEAFQFFDSQNARGKKLYPHDLLKAYHLREMQDLDVEDTEKVVKVWEDMNQQELSLLFQDYLYRLKAWMRGEKADELDEKNIKIFKGIHAKDQYPYAQFYKGAFAFADTVNRSHVPFVTGAQKVSVFQLDTPIIAGKPFFYYAKHYFDILADIQNNDKYAGYYINDNPIIATLDQRKYRNGVGNQIVRLLLDTAILLYVDRFCPSKPNADDLEKLDQFVVFAFVWSYSLRAQYTNLGWASAQNYIMGDPELINSFNMYRVITQADSPNALMSILSEYLVPLPQSAVRMEKDLKGWDMIDMQGEKGRNVFYLHYFKQYKFLKENA